MYVLNPAPVVLGMAKWSLYGINDYGGKIARYLIARWSTIGPAIDGPTDAASALYRTLRNGACTISVLEDGGILIEERVEVPQRLLISGEHAVEILWEVRGMLELQMFKADAAFRALVPDEQKRAGYYLQN